MKLKDAILYLRRYQDRRTGYDCRPMRDAGIEPARLTKAINIILARHGMPKPLRNCEKCEHYSSMFGCCRLPSDCPKDPPLRNHPSKSVKNKKESNYV